MTFMNGFCHWSITSRNCLIVFWPKKQCQNYSKKIRYLGINIYKFQNGLSPPIMNDIFIIKQSTYICQKFKEFPPQLKALWNMVRKLSYRRPRLWNLIPDNRKPEPTLKLFKKKMRKWTFEPCPYSVKRICIVEALWVNENNTINFVNGYY